MQLTLTAALALLLLLASATPTPSTETKVQLMRRTFTTKNGVVDMDALNAHLAHVQNKIARGFANYRKNTGTVHRNDNGALLQKRTTGAVPLTDDLDGVLWQGSIAVGTPASAFTVEFDTGSGDLFIPSTNCTGPNCEGHNIYDTLASSTAKDQNKVFSLAFGDGSVVSGEQFDDTVRVGGLTATGQRVGAASVYPVDFSPINYPPDGLMGMAFQGISEFNAPPVFQTLVSEGQTTQPEFGFTLLDNGGELFLGGTDTSKFKGTLTFTSLITTPAFWEISLAGASVGTRTIFTSAQDAIVDTSMTLISGDSRNVAALYAAIPGSKNASFNVGPGFFTVPCDDIPDDISLTLGGKKFTISADSFNFGPVFLGSPDCVGGIIADDSEGFWILGNAFLRNVYTAFDVGNLRVGFAPLA